MMLPEKSPIIMGILNITPDSFSGDGVLTRTEISQKIQKLIDGGAHIIDVGAQSTRPGFLKISCEDEMLRLSPFIEAVCEFPETFFSIDTFYPAAARLACRYGVKMINDVSGEINEEMAAVVCEYSCFWVITHNAQVKTDDPALEVAAFLEEAASKAVALGVRREKIVIDPGIGFAKSNEQCAQILHSLEKITKLEYPVLVGASRKRVVGYLCGIEDARLRDEASLHIHISAVEKGARIIRTHRPDLKLR